jgi:hypothetical protein
MLFIYVEIETFCTEHSRLRDFIMLCNDHEYKRLAETRVEVSQMHKVFDKVFNNHSLAKLFYYGN